MLPPDPGSAAGIQVAELTASTGGLALIANHATVAIPPANARTAAMISTARGLRLLGAFKRGGW
jgi:hypothetical protein